MAYALRYVMQFTSDRGNEIRIEILQKGYVGEIEYKSLGTAPVLAIEEGDGAVKGSSLSLAIQADVEGELKSLYTTDNKLFKVDLYRNSALYWQGYILPELYSEIYIDAPYDVSITATDQLATLKNVTYDQGDGQKTLYEIVTHILALTQIVLPVKIHMNLSVGENLPFLENSYVDTYAYIGQPCYDVLNTILTSCNACILQIDNQWLIQSLTDTSDTYRLDGVAERIEHTRIGQMGVEKVYPEGTMTMVNDPALKGVRLDYSHILRNSFLKNASCTSKEYWQFNPSEITEDNCPRVVTSPLDGITYRLYHWQLPQTDVKNGNGLQLWQEIDIKADSNYKCQISVDYLYGYSAEMLLLALVFDGDDGIRRRLTAKGWEQVTDISDINNYIQITGEPKATPLYNDVSNYSNYETAKILFNLPEVDGKLRVGFINTLVEPPMYPPLLYELGLYIYVTNVFLSYENITGKTSTTIVEENATQEQEEDVIAYGDKISATNEVLISLNTLRNSAMIPLSQYTLSSSADTKTFESYFLAMLQEKSRYYGVKKMLLQGTIMGDNILAGVYLDTFSDKVMRLVSCQYDLLQDTMSVSLEEVPDTFVEYNEEVYATDNKAPSTSTSGTSSSSVVNSGSSYLGLQSDGDVFVKDNRSLVGKEARFDNLVLPLHEPEKRSEEKTYIYSSDPSRVAVDIAKIAQFVDEQNGLWSFDKDNNAVRTTLNLIVEGGGAFGMGTESGEVPSASVSIKFEGSDVLYNPINGVITLPAYPSAGGGVADSVDWSNVTGKPDFATVATSGQYSDLSGTPTIPTSLKSPYALTFGSKTYDGSAAKTIVASDLGALTAHQAIYALTINNSAGTAQVTYTPNSKAASLTLTKAMVGLGNVDNTADSAKSVKYATTAGSAPASDVYDWAKKATLAASDVPNLDWSKITSGKPTTLAGYGITDKVAYRETYNNFMHNTNEFTFAAPAYSSYIWFNYRTASGGLDGAITEYRFAKGAGISYADIRAAKYIVNGGTSSQFLKADGSLDGTSYLPLSGGIIKGVVRIERAGTILACVSTSDTTPYINFRATINGGDIDLGDLGVDTSKNLVFYNGGAWRTIVHSGNIGSQSVNYASSAGNANALNGISSKNYAYYSPGNGYLGFNLNDATLSPHGQGDGFIEYYDNGAFYNSVWGWVMAINGFKGNADTATKLQTARTIWGQSFDGTGNVDGAFKYGYINLEKGNEINSKDTNGTGVALCLNWQGSGNVIMTVGGGNTLIGTSYDNGAKLQVNGGVTTYGSINLQSVGEIQNALAISRYDNNTGYYLGSRNAGLGVADGGCLVYAYGSTPISFYTYGSERMRINGDGDVSMYGNLTVTGGGAFGSDIRYKDIISSQQLDLETIVNAPLFTFKWNDREDNATHLGTSAQYWLETQAKDAVNTANKAFFHLDYGALAVGIGISVAREVKGVKTEVEQLRERVEYLETKLSRYEQVWQH